MQTAFWKKPIFWVFFVILIAIPLVSFLITPYFKKNTPSATPAKTQHSTPVVLIPKPGSCQILEERFCSQAEVVDWKNTQGEISKMIGFRLKPGTPLLVPINNGMVSKAKLPDNGLVKGYMADVADPNDPNPFWYYFYGDLEFDDMRSPTLQAGQQFGRIGDRGITNGEGYNLLLKIRKGIGTKIANDTDQLKKLFPLIKL